MEHQNLRLYEPRPKDEIICFVRGVPYSFEEQEILENVECGAEPRKVERVKRRGRNNQLLDTANIKLTVKGANVPERVRIYGCNFKAELYIFPIRQCRQCWRYGHGIKHCKSRPRCRKCGGRHDETACGEQEKCVNCGRQHDAQARECPERKRRWDILEKMKRGATYQEAAVNHPKLTNRFDILQMEGDNEEDNTEADLDSQCRSRGGEETERISVSRQHTYRSKRRVSEQGRLLQESTQSSRRRGEQDSDEEQNSQIEERIPEITRPCNRCQSNPHGTSEFERFIDKLRKDFQAEARSRKWIDPLKAIHARIVVGVSEANNPIETDRLLIATAEAIRQLISKEEIEEESTEGRIETASKSVV